MSASLRNTGPDQWMLEGVLDFKSVPKVWPQLKKAVSVSRSSSLSLAEVSSSNSAAMAMLLEACQAAKAANGELILSDIPEALLDLLRLSNAEELLVG